MANFETRMKTPVTALTQATTSSAPVLGAGLPTHGAAYDPKHPWGVHWPGHADYPTRDAPMFLAEDFLGAFKTWSKFSLGGPELWGTLFYSVSSIASSSLP